MRLLVVPYPPYRAELGAEPIELTMEDGATLRDVLRTLARRTAQFQPFAEARHDEWLWGQLLVHVRGEMVLLDEPLHDGDRLELLPPIAGG